MSNDTLMLDPIIVKPDYKPAPITIGGKPYYPGPSFGVSYDMPAHVVIKPVNLQQGQVGLVNLAEFSIKIRDLNGAIDKYHAQLSKSELHKTISEAKNWTNKYALDFENGQEIEVYIAILESALKILENSEKNLPDLQKSADKKFDELLNNNIVKLSNFKKFKDNKPWLISAAYESNIAHFRSSKMTAEYIRLWKENVEYPKTKILLEKQKIEASLRSILDIRKELNKSLEDLNRDLQNKKINTIVEYINNFFEHITTKYGSLAGQEAKKLAELSRGKKIRNINDALKAFDKYKDNINKKFNAKDRQAISKALQSLNMKDISNDLYKFNKAFKYSGKVFAGTALVATLKEGYEKGNWKPFYLEVEKQTLDKTATYVVGLALTTLARTPLGIIGYGVLMVVVSALISDDLVEKIHKVLFK